MAVAVGYKDRLRRSMGDALSTCAGGEGAGNNNNKFNKPKASFKFQKSAHARDTPFGASNVRSRRAVSDNPFEQYAREKISKSALVSQKIDAKEEYELEKAKAMHGDGATSSMEKARRKYIVKLMKLKEQASTNFHYTLVKQIELEIAAIKKVGDKNIRGDEDYLSVPLEVPKVSFELKEINHKPSDATNNHGTSSTPAQHVKNVGSADSNESECPETKGQETLGTNIDNYEKQLDAPHEKQLDAPHEQQLDAPQTVKMEKTIKEFRPNKSPVQPEPPQDQYLSYEEKRNQAWKQDISFRMEKKSKAKMDLQKLLRRHDQQAKSNLQ